MAKESTWTPERKAEWKKEYMKTYNKAYQKNRVGHMKTYRENQYRQKPFYMNPKQPHVLTLSDVAHLYHMTLSEVRKYFEEGKLVPARYHNGYPRFLSPHVLDLAEELIAKGEIADTGTLMTYEDDLKYHKTLKETDPEKYAELCSRLRKARAIKNAKRSSGEESEEPEND